MLTLEPDIIARIKAEVPGLATVASVGFLAGAQDIAPYIPAAFVIPGGAQYETAGADGGPVTETQHWEVVLYVKHVKDPADLATTSSLAGPLLEGIVGALHGWRFDRRHHPMAIAARPDPVYYPGFGEFPLSFETRRVVTGTN